jgi:hypothetical protein
MRVRLDSRPYAPAGLLLATALAAGLLTDAGAGAGAGPESVPRAPRPPAPPRHPLAVLLRDHVVRASPSAAGRRIAAVVARRPLTHVRTVLPVLGRATAAGGGSWVHVRLPGRPNGHAGWISADATRQASTDWRISIALSKRLVTAYHRGRVEGRFRAVVGRGSTPTPRGRFFVEETVPLSRLGAPFALAISARSNVYQRFAGGPGQVALHGTTGLAAALGTAASHGCVRLSPQAMAWLARRIRPGVPLTIGR